MSRCFFELYDGKETKRCPFKALPRKSFCIKHNDLNKLEEEFKRRRNG